MKVIGIIILVTYFYLMMALLPIVMDNTGRTTSDNIVTTPTSETTMPEPTVKQLPAPGRVAPDFELQNLEGETVSLSDHRGSPVMVNFWASWCEPCRFEMPYIQEVFEDPFWESIGLEILVVNVQESSAVARDFMEENGLSFPVLLDMTGGVARMYNIRSIPTTLFIDEDGIIQYIDVGSFSSKADIEQRLDDLIS